MKKFLVLTSIIFSLLIINSCNPKEETASNKIVPIPKSPVVETKQTDPQQSWKESLLSGKAIETEKDIESIKLIIEKAVENNRLDELQTFLETESKKEKVPPQILFGLSLAYGRKGLVKEEYKAIEKLEEQVKQRPGIVFNLSLVYGRKETLKSQIDKAEAEAKALLQGYISVKSTPAGAEVYLDGELKGKTPFTTGGLGEGSYAVELQLKDYTDLSKTISVKAGKTTGITEKLTLIPGSLVINSDPPGSTVLLNGEEIGETPLELNEIVPDKYDILIKKERYQEQILHETIEPGNIKTLNVKLNSSFGNLSITNFTNNATVYLDGTKIFLNYGLLPGTRNLNNVSVGRHDINIQKEGFFTTSAKIDIISNKVTSINGNLIQDTPYNTETFKNKLYLDGHNDYGEIRYSSKLNLRSKISIEAWIYIENLSIDSNVQDVWGYTSSRPIISQCHDGSTAGNYTFGISSNDIYFVFETIDSRYTCSFKFEEKRWYHVAVTHKFGNGSGIKIYIDGKVVKGIWVDDSGNRISGDGLPASNSRKSYFVGSYDPNRIKKYFKGYIDELRVWNTIRTEVEINQSLYKEPDSGEKGLVLYYNFNNSENNKVVDHGGKNNLLLKGDAHISN